MIYQWLRNQWDRTAAVIATVIGVVCIVAGWLGVSGAALPTEQLPYLASGAVFGIFALGVGATLWLSADLRDEWRELHEIRRRLPEPAAEEGPVAAVDLTAAPATAADDATARPRPLPVTATRAGR